MNSLTSEYELLDVLKLIANYWNLQYATCTNRQNNGRNTGGQNWPTTFLGGVNIILNRMKKADKWPQI